MHKPCTYLFPVVAFACLVASARAVAQDCVGCGEWEEDPEYYVCGTVDGVGHQACKLSKGGKQCSKSTLPDGSPDCGVVLALDGRGSQHVESGQWPQAVGGEVELPARVQRTAPAVADLSEVARHGCNGAIIQRRYSSAKIAELRSGLRRVTI